ncbi:MAG: DUF4416 family protein [Spirochaetales bacterium]|nr:DUF4416 family protein [Spirochaetales bacterium]
MGKIDRFAPEKLIIAVLISKLEMYNSLVADLENHFGPVDYTSSSIDFKFTHYYNNEMGKEIKRLFLSFNELISPDTLSDIKITTNKIEKNFTVKGNRKINLDPGMLSLKRFVLATTKDNGHRIPLQKGIFGEVTLLFMNKNFSSLPWTYIDYQSEEYSGILKEIRNIYKNNLKMLKQEHK